MYKDKISRKIFISVAFLLTCIFMVVQNSNISRYQLDVGDVAPAKIKSPEQIVNQYQTELLKEEAKKQVATIYKIDEIVTDRLEKSLENFFVDVEQNRSSYDFMVEYNENLTEGQNPKIFNFKTALPNLNDEDTESIIIMDSENFIQFEEAVNTVVSETLEEGVTESNIAKTSVIIKDTLKSKVDPSYVDLAFNIALEFIEQNLFVDEESTNIAIESAISVVKPIHIKKGQTIIDEGDVITEETYRILTDIGYIENESSINFSISIGYITLTLLVFISFFSYVNKYNNKSLKKKNVSIAFFTMYILGIISMYSLSATLYNVYIPLLFIFWIAVLIDYKLGYVVTVIFSVLGIGIAGYETADVVFVLLSGAFMVSFANSLVNRTGILRLTLYICLFNTISMAVLNAMFNYNFVSESWFTSQNFIHLAISAGSSILILSIAFGSMPIWEVVFGILTPTTLIELTKPSNPILRRLIIEAPGTYHHSLIVANLAEEAAMKIGANSNLARVGSYYHDIGKLSKPTNFAENQNNTNVHDRISYLNSVKIIKAHVTDGIELAKEHKVPKQIIDFIEQHHGKTVIKYFYLKALEEDENISEAIFRYDGQKPSSKETAIVMLADTVEAAVRSVVKNVDSMDEVKDFVDKLITDKAYDGQLDECNLTFKDLQDIKEAFFNVFKGMYHERIVYPDEKEDDEEKEESNKEKSQEVLKENNKSNVEETAKEEIQEEEKK